MNITTYGQPDTFEVLPHWIYGKTAKFAENKIKYFSKIVLGGPFLEGRAGKGETIFLFHLALPCQG